MMIVTIGFLPKRFTKSINLCALSFFSALIFWSFDIPNRVYFFVVALIPAERSSTVQ